MLTRGELPERRARSQFNRPNQYPAKEPATVSDSQCLRLGTREALVTDANANGQLLR